MTVSKRSIWYVQDSGLMHVHVEGSYSVPAALDTTGTDEDLLDLTDPRMASFFPQEGHITLERDIGAGSYGTGNVSHGLVMKTLNGLIAERVRTVSQVGSGTKNADGIDSNRIPSNFAPTTNMPAIIEDLQTSNYLRWTKLNFGMDYAKLAIRTTVNAALDDPLTILYAVSLVGLRGY